MSHALQPLVFAFPVTLVPLCMAALCGIAAAQHRSRALRSLTLALTLRGIGLPLLALQPPCGSLCGTLFLLASGLFCLSVCEMTGRARSPLWLLVAPLLWLPVHAWAVVAGPARLSIDMVWFSLLDDALGLLCLPALLLHPHRGLSQRCLCVLLAFFPIGSAFWLARALYPAALSAVPVQWCSTPLLLARCVLCPGLLILTLMDMTTERERRLARQDDLSGLLNRRGFFRAAARLSERTLLLFDIDHFKRINDTFGHAAGDDAIRRFAHVIRDLLGNQAILARVGGEEFTAALDRVSPEQAVLIAERIRIAFADAEQALGTGITVSIGVALPSDLLSTVGEQLASADRALYQAKKNGRNRVELDPDPFRLLVNAA